MKTSSYQRWDWPAAVLITAAVFTSAVRLNATDWTKDLEYVSSLAVLGTMLGLALGISQFGRAALRWLVTGYTLTILPAHLSRIISSENTSLGRLASLGGRLAASFSLLFSGKAIEDYLFFVTLMTILFWSIGIYCGYRLMRRPAILPVLLPATLPILIIQYYDGYKAERIWGLAFFFFIALLLIGRMNLLKSRERWEEQNVVAGSDPEFDLNKNMAIAAAVIILAAWMLPAPSAVLPAAARAWQSFNKPFENTRQRIDDMLAALKSDNSTNTAGELYGNAMSLGRSAGSGETEIFTVRAPQNNLPRLYWRVRTYDTYQNGIWQTANSQNTPFDPEQGSLVRTDILPAPTAEFVFTWQTSRSSLLTTPSQPVWASRTGAIQTAKNDQIDTDPLSWSVSPNLQTGDQYQIRALLSNPSRKALRAAGEEYPDWIKEHYLQIPEAIAKELGQLADQITREQPTIFDKVEAVTGYLRQNMTYSDTIPAPPPGTDPLNWFLFGWKSGFCNYYASAEVLLLRSVGIPARMVVGYSQGTSGNYGMYSVRGLDAHAWPEVYFPQIGWVEFEPTVNQDALVRPSGEETNPRGNPNQLPAAIDGLDNQPRGGHEAEDLAATDAATSFTFWGLTRGQWLWVIISLVAIAAMGISAWQIQRTGSFSQKAPRAIKAIYSRYNLRIPTWVERWERWGEVSDVEHAFHAINQALNWLRQPQPNHVTPTERAELLKNLIPEAAEDVELISAALEQTLFTPHPADPANAIRAGWRIRFFTARKIILRRIYGVNNDR